MGKLIYSVVFKLLHQHKAKNYAYTVNEGFKEII